MLLHNYFLYLLLGGFIATLLHERRQYLNLQQDYNELVDEVDKRCSEERCSEEEEEPAKKTTTKTDDEGYEDDEDEEDDKEEEKDSESKDGNSQTDQVTQRTPSAPSCLCVDTTTTKDKEDGNESSSSIEILERNESATGMP